MAFWTFFEYTLHRFIFHLRPDNEWGRKMHFIIHGVHHDYPHDPMRLVMPPAVSIPLAIIMYFVFRGVLGPEWSLPAFAGFLLGYLVYDMGHYHIHHHRADNKISLALRRYHYRHHFQQSDRGFGVTSPLWDRVFRTSPVIRRRRAASALRRAHLRAPEQLLRARQVGGRVDVEHDPLRVAVAPQLGLVDAHRAELGDDLVQRALLVAPRRSASISSGV